MSRRFSGHGMIALGAALLAIVGWREGMAVQDAPVAFKPAAPRHDLMEWHDKAFSALRKEIGRGKGEQAAEHAWLLAELANVNSTHSPRRDYQSWAGQVRDDAVAAAKLLKEGKVDEAKPIVKRMSDTCNTCHDKYQ